MRELQESVAIVGGKKMYAGGKNQAVILAQQCVEKNQERFIELSYDQKRRMGQLSHEFVAEHFDKRTVV